MATQRERDAVDYLKKHRIVELMDHLASMLFYHRPDDPREFLIEKLEELKGSEQRGPGPSLFSGTDLDAVLRILDPANQGHITFAQYKRALTTLGVRGADECPEGANEDRIPHQRFRAEAERGLQRCPATPERP